MKIKGVIFDMDGVILDSEKLYVRFWSEAGRACGYNFERKHALAIRSMARPFAVSKLKSFFGDDFNYDDVRNKRIELMSEYIEKNGIDTKHYAEEILSYLKENGYKTAIATATPPERTEKYLKQVGLYDYFDELISASMVENGKPAPDIYKFASAKLSLSPENCIAVEDSPNGVQSASSAGCVTVMVPDMDSPDDEVIKKVYRVADNLKELENIIEEINGGKRNA
ncbi:MAG: HAD family phosphatase [Ruminococcus sp.]|nr:HAD family phosphatase [Ruminococcus sp.]